MVHGKLKSLPRPHFTPSFGFYFQNLRKKKWPASLVNVVNKKNRTSCVQGEQIKKWTSSLILYRIWNNRTKNYQFFHSNNSTFTKEKHLKTIVLLKGIISLSKISKYNKTIVHKYHKVKAGCLISSFVCTKLMQKKKDAAFQFQSAWKNPASF